MTIAVQANTQRTVTVNSFDSNPGQDVAYVLPRATGEIAATGGTLAVAFAVGNVPGLLIAGSVLATTAVFSHIGRNHDVRERPLIEETRHIARIGDRIVYKLGEKSLPLRVWRASEFELREHAEGRMNSALSHGLRQSLPVKALYTYPRLALAKLRDFAVTTYSAIPGIGYGVSFNEGVAARRLERAGLITPNPRTQQHISLARDWYTRKGKTLG